MQYLPGTNLTGNAQTCENVFASIFSTGGLVLSQVCTITGLESHMVQNWVKRKFVSAPKEKKYSKNQLCRIICINLLKESLSLDAICALLSHINGVLAEEADDLIDDSQLYFYFVQFVFLAEEHTTQGDIKHNPNDKAILETLLESYIAPVPYAKKRLAEVLEIMRMAYLSAQYKQQALLLYKIAEIE